MAQTDIILPVYQDSLPEILYQCLDSLVKNTRDFNLIMIESSKKQPININEGLKRVKSKYFVIIDWDVILPENWLPPLIKIMDNNKDIGILGVRMYGQNYNGANAEIDNETVEVNNVAAGCMVCRNIGLKWDERYTSGIFADTDYCQQYLDKEYKVMLTGKVSVEHNCVMNQELRVEEYEKNQKIYNFKWKNQDYSKYVSSLILSWNQLKTVKMSVENMRKDKLDIWVVDNGSKDGTQEYLKNQKDINVIQFEKNMGISYARNRVIEAFKRKYLLMLDGDIVYIPGSADGMVFEIQKLSLKCYCFGIHNIKNGEDNWGGTQDYKKSTKKWENIGLIYRNIPIAWTQYGLFKGDIIRRYKFPEYGPYFGPGYGFEDDWIHAKLEEDGYESDYCTAPLYYHSKPHHGETDLTDNNIPSKIAERREELFKRFPDFKHWSDGKRE